jgi:hypothetical protein
MVCVQMVFVRVVRVVYVVGANMEVPAYVQ